MELDFIKFVSSNLPALLFGAVLVEAIVEIIGDFLPNNYSRTGARSVAAAAGIVVAFGFNISITEKLSESVTVQAVVSTVLAGLIMSRSAEWIHSLIKSITSLPKAIANAGGADRVVKTAAAAPEQSELNVNDQSL